MIRWVKRNCKIILIAGFALLTFGYVCFTESGLVKVYKLQQEKDRYEREISALQDTNIALAERARLLKNDRETIERAIRENLRMVLPDDTIFIFESSQAAPGN